MESYRRYGDGSSPNEVSDADGLPNVPEETREALERKGVYVVGAQGAEGPLWANLFGTSTDGSCCSCLNNNSTMEQTLQSAVTTATRVVRSSASMGAPQVQVHLQDVAPPDELLLTEMNHTSDARGVDEPPPEDLLLRQLVAAPDVHIVDRPPARASAQFEEDGSGSERPTRDVPPKIGLMRTVGTFSEPNNVCLTRESPRGLQAKIQFIVSHPVFEGSFGLLIIINTIVLCFEVQYKSFDMAHDLPFGDNVTRGDDRWPGATSVFDIFGWAFGVLFTVEVLAKIFGEGWQFWSNGWNVFDSGLIALWILEKCIQGFWVLMHPMLLRMLRMMRIARMARLVKTVQEFDTLQVLILSIKGCVSVLVWAACALMGIMTVVGMFMNGQMSDYIEGEGNLDFATRVSLFKYFGSYTRSVLTMYEITLGNFVPVCRLFFEDVNANYGLFICLYKFIVGFAVLKVISGVFLHETFRVAANDDELMVVQKMRATQKHVKKMKRLMKVTDTSGNGVCDRHEFMKALGDPTIKAWLASMDVEVDDIDMLYDTIDNGDGLITTEELIHGVARIRGAARSIDMLCMLTRMTETLTEVRGVSSGIEELRQAAAGDRDRHSGKKVQLEK
eukprot:NODE_2985_length_2110_cov_9.759960.p1 GENE.NODE_2985_length_2110_cov_9.759960~~NODE_2985_length_2110_cov_9.759960.p1  ORF type:complete len:616 (+),score=141.58 NODE_2985_length_2110_cov_9.759960:2-1849(+)